MTNATTLSPREAADVIERLTGCTVHHATVTRWVNSGVRGERLRARRVGHRIRIAEGELRRFLDALNDEPVGASR